MTFKYGLHLLNFSQTNLAKTHKINAMCLLQPIAIVLVAWLSMAPFRHSGSVLKRGDQWLSDSVLQYLNMCFETIVIGCKRDQQISFFYLSQFQSWLRTSLTSAIHI